MTWGACEPIPKKDITFMSSFLSHHLRHVPICHAMAEEVTLTSRTLSSSFFICLLLKLPPLYPTLHVLSLSCLGLGWHAVAVCAYSSSLYLEIQFPQDLWIGFLCSNNILCVGCNFFPLFRLVVIMVSLLIWLFLYVYVFCSFLTEKSFAEHVISIMH